MYNSNSFEDLGLNPYNDDGLYTSSKIEATHKKIDKPILIWSSFAFFFICFFIRNVIMHHIGYVRDAFAEDSHTNKQKVNIWGYENIVPLPEEESY